MRKPNYFDAAFTLESAFCLGIDLELEGEGKKKV